MNKLISFSTGVLTVTVKVQAVSNSPATPDGVHLLEYHEYLKRYWETIMNDPVRYNAALEETKMDGEAFRKMVDSSIISAKEWQKESDGSKRDGEEIDPTEAENASPVKDKKFKQFKLSCKSRKLEPKTDLVDTQVAVWFPYVNEPVEVEEPKRFKLSCRSNKVENETELVDKQVAVWFPNIVEYHLLLIDEEEILFTEADNATSTDSVHDDNVRIIAESGPVTLFLCLPTIAILFTASVCWVV